MVRFDANQRRLGVCSYAVANAHGVVINIFSADVAIISPRCRVASIPYAHVYDICAAIDRAGSPVPCIILLPAGHRFPGILVRTYAVEAFDNE